MAATEFINNLLGINLSQFTPLEALLLENELFTRVYEELLEFYVEQHKEYTQLTKTNFEKENMMQEIAVLRLVINEIIMTKEYSLKGVAYHTQVHEDVLCDLMTGENKSPSLHLSRRIIDLHRTVKPEFYKEIIKKVIIKYLSKL